MTAEQLLYEDAYDVARSPFDIDTIITLEDVWREIRALRPLDPEPDDLQPNEVRYLRWPEEGVSDFRLLASDGRKLAGQIHGEGETVVFLLHGMPSGRRGPMPDAAELTRNGFRIITYDRPGYGQSTRHEGRTVADAAYDVQAIADALGVDKFAVIGRSGGAPHALACAALLGERVERVVALGTNAPMDAPGLDHEEGMADENRSRGRTQEEKDADHARQAGEIRRDPRWKLRDLTPYYAESDIMFMKRWYVTARIAASHFLALENSPDGWIDDDHAFQQPWGFDLRSIKVPVKLWVGSKDPFTPERHTLWLTDQMAGTEGVEAQVSEDLSHFTGMDIMPFLEVFFKDVIDKQYEGQRKLASLIAIAWREYANPPRTNES